MGEGTDGLLRSGGEFIARAHLILLVDLWPVHPAGGR
jgi:hypothetical protein